MLANSKTITIYVLPDPYVPIYETSEVINKAFRLLDVVKEITGDEFGTSTLAITEIN